MSFNFLKYKENEYLVPVKIQDKESYYYDLINIENSFTGRVDAWISNTFIIESVQLIVNAINLFETGYFDCAFYSLRQSLEVSITMIYLVDIDASKKDQELHKWKSEEGFPMYRQMIDFLKRNGEIFKDFREKLDDYFTHIESIKKKLNKYVHKQGFDKFYISKNHPINRSKSRTCFIEKFENYLKTCIGAIAVFRLAIDPFPVLLNDEEMYHRTDNLMTKPYSDDFIEKYIGFNHINSYKETDIYKGHYDYFITEEKKKECVTNVVKNQYIDTEKIDEILEQKNLLNDLDLGAILICKLSDKITNIYVIGGLMTYYTNRDTVRTKIRWSTRDFRKFKESKSPFNIPYDEAFITYLVLKDQDYFIEHNEKFSIEEIEKFKTIT